MHGPPQGERDRTQGPAELAHVRSFGDIVLADPALWVPQGREQSPGDTSRTVEPWNPENLRPVCPHAAAPFPMPLPRREVCSLHQTGHDLGLCREAAGTRVSVPRPWLSTRVGAGRSSPPEAQCGRPFCHPLSPLLPVPPLLPCSAAPWRHLSGPPCGSFGFHPEVQRCCQQGAH